MQKQLPPLITFKESGEMVVNEDIAKYPGKYWDKDIEKAYLFDTPEAASASVPKEQLHKSPLVNPLALYEILSIEVTEMLHEDGTKSYTM